MEPLDWPRPRVLHDGTVMRDPPDLGGKQLAFNPTSPHAVFPPGTEYPGVRARRPLAISPSPAGSGGNQYIRGPD